MKKIFIITLTILSIAAFVNAQDITVTIDDSTGAFYVRNDKPDTLMVIDGKTGNVGIGTTEPQEKLQIHGDLIVHEIAHEMDGSPRIGGNILAADLEGNVVDLFAQHGHGYLKTTGTEMDLVLGAGFWGDHLTIKSNGNVGIGTTNPLTKLDVNGTATATAFSGALNASDILTGTLHNDRFNALSDLGGGSGSTFLRKDGTWTTTSISTDDDDGVAEIYGVGWDADGEAPTKNDVYDKIESLGDITR